jgi:predicted metalloprotease with PDZ domain
MKLNGMSLQMIRTAVVFVFLWPHTALGQRSVEYDVTFPNAAQHEAHIVATFRGIPRGSVLEARMARSSPGRYAASGFAKNVYDVKATDSRGRELSITRPAPHGWDIAGHDGTVRITYTVWGDRIDGTFLSIDHSHAHMNMPATFMFAHGMESAPIRLTIHPRAGWRVATQLAPINDTVFTAPNMQWLMDSPTEVGPITIRSWTETHKGKPSTWRIAMHHLGTDAQVDSFAVLARAIVDEAIAMWGEPAPYDLRTYTFIADYLPWASGDGMEHRNSTIITSNRRTLADRAKRVAALGTLSHEFFHSWNMERLRSKALEPFDFERENISDELWLGEGFTQYYGPLIIRRAGFYTDEEFAQSLAGVMISTIDAPARRHGSAVDMSRMAPFLDGGSYLDPTNAQNTFLTYYDWGAAIAAALDLTLRQRFKLSLDDYMRALWGDYGSHQSPAFAPERPYTMRDLRTQLAQLTRDSVFASDFFRRYIEGREVPDFASLLAAAGFRLSTDSVEKPFLGASMDNDTTRVFVNWSQEGGSMYDAGIASGDLVYAIDGVSVASIDSLNAVVARHKVGDVVQVDVEQRKVRRKLPMTLRGRRALKLVTYESAGLRITDQIRLFRKSWLESKRK